MRRSSLIGFFFLFFCHPAWAHLASTRFGEFYSGLLHPWLSLQYILPWLALSLLAGLQGKLMSRWLVFFFPVFVAFGVMFAYWFGQPSWLPIANLILIAAMGLLLAWSPAISPLLFTGIMLLNGLIQGVANVALELRGNEQVLYILGVCAAAYLCAVLISAVSYSSSQRYVVSRVALRAIGGWVAAVGIMVSGFSLLVPSS